MPDSQDPDQLIAQFKSQANLVLKEFEEFVYKNFEELDRDGDGFLSKEELEAALLDKHRTIKEVGFLNFMLLRLKDIASSFNESDSGAHADCISRKDVQAYFANLQKKGTSGG